MCLAIPAKIVSIQDGVDAVVDFKGLLKKVYIELVPDVKMGDYVLVHAGFVIQIIDRSEAIEILSIFDEVDSYKNS